MNAVETIQEKVTGFNMSNPEMVAQLNAFSGLCQFKQTPVFTWLMNCPEKLILLDTGNQFGKGACISMDYVYRVLGYHPIAERNVVYFECKNGHTFAPYKTPENRICPQCESSLERHKRESYVFRFCSGILPGQSGDGVEVRNVIYPAFKRWLPSFLIKKDITVRNPAMTIKNPLYPEKDIVIDFVGYGQETKDTAGVQRMSVWADEAMEPDFYEEQIPRLVKEQGDMIISYTPAERTSWLFDSIFNKARIIYRTDAVREFFRKYKGLHFNPIEYRNSNRSIAVIMAAMDDNPTFTLSMVEEACEPFKDDIITLGIRRYGVFSQYSGRIFKEFDHKTHVISKSEYFPVGIPASWMHGEAVDYHQQTPWAHVGASISPEDEVFVWIDFNASPEKFVTDEICMEWARRTMGYKFGVSLVDPLAEAVKKDKLSVYQDMQSSYYRLSREGLGTMRDFRLWDTKGEHGRDEIRKRLRNSHKVRTPFCNKTIDGYLPTIWFLDTCSTMIEYISQWRWKEWASTKDQHTKEPKNEPDEKWSHFPIALECLFKEPAFRVKRGIMEFNKRVDSYFRMN